MKTAINTNRKCTLEKIFTIIVILYQILLVYSIKSISISTCILLFLCVVLFLNMWKKNAGLQLMKPLEPIVVLMVIQMCYMFVMGENVLQMGQYVFYLLIAFVLLPNCFLRNFGLKIYGVAVLISSIFAIIQFAVLKLFGYYISGFLPFGEFAHYINNMYDTMLALGADVRPRSFFSEPSVYGAFAGIFLIELLAVRKRISWKEICLAVVISLGQICVTSSTGILLMVLAWLGYAVRIVVTNRYTRSSIIILIFMLLGGVCFLFTDMFRMFAERTFNFQVPGGTMGRVSGYFELFDLTKYTLTEFIVGHSFVKAEFFLPGWASVMWHFGIVGVLVYIATLYRMYRGARCKEQKYMVYIIALMAFFLTLFYSVNELFYFAVYFAYGAAIEERGESNGR